MNVATPCGGIGAGVRRNHDQLILPGSMMDRSLPRAEGCGEVGAIGPAPAVLNAAVDALRDCGVRHVGMPAMPAKIRGIINAGGRPMAAE